jgi:hypothetical protein
MSAGVYAAPDKQQLASAYPVWFSNPNYDGYLGAVGIAGNKTGGYARQKRLAISIAQEELARQSGIMVESELSIEKTLIQKGLSDEYASTIKSLSKHNSREFLRNVVVKDEWVDPKTGELYLWMVIEKPQGKEIIDESFRRRVSGLIRGVTAEGSCAVVNMSAEQARLIALQRARSAAIEKAAGVAVSSSTLITNFELAVDLIKTYSKGYIINEEVKWLPLGQYQMDATKAPIPEYRVRIVVDVYIPKKKIKPISLSAKMNNTVFRAGEKARIDIKTEREAKVAIFNLTADDKVVMLFPNGYDGENIIPDSGTFVFPSANSPIELEVQNLPGHKRDAEALFVVAMDRGHKRAFAKAFKPLTAMSFSEFFKKYSEIADYCEDVMLTYEVVSE